MKQAILQALAYPRFLVTGHLDLLDCEHAGQYSHDDGVCTECYQAGECEWLYDHATYLSLEERSLEELEAALAFAMGYVDARVTGLGHPTRTCGCEACRWLRKSRKLYDRVVILLF